MSSLTFCLLEIRSSVTRLPIQIFPSGAPLCTVRALKKKPLINNYKYSTSIYLSTSPISLSCPYTQQQIQLSLSQSTFHYITRNRFESRVFHSESPQTELLHSLWHSLKKQQFPFCSCPVPFNPHLFPQLTCMCYPICGMCSHTRSRTQMDAQGLAHLHETSAYHFPHDFEWQGWVGTLNQMLFNPVMRKPANHTCSRHTHACIHTHAQSQ